MRNLVCMVNKKNDLEASISPKKQQDLIIEEIINWLE